MDRNRLLELFDNGSLIRPTDREPNLVHLVRAVASIAGVSGVDDSPATRHLIDAIGPAEHLVFVLLDGLGMNIMERLSPESFLVRHLRMPIRATCPSTTACALTTVTTAEYPSRHGVTGWFTYLPELDLTATILPFAERFSSQSLTHRGIRAQDVLPLPPITPRMTHAPLTLVPAYIANTTYNVYSRGGTTGLGYASVANAVDEIIANVNRAAGPTYAHLYLHDIDTLCHHIGATHPNILPAVMKIDAEMSRLSEALRGRGRIVVCADHGLIDVPAADQTLLMAGDPLLELLLVPPTGDARMPIFHVQEGEHAAFAKLFRQRFGDRMFLLSRQEAEELELFGPGELSPLARPRFGDFIAIAYRAATLAYHPPDRPLGRLYVSVHAGLSPEEMWVPLCVA